jgi:hypothetical protein
MPDHAHAQGVGGRGPRAVLAALDAIGRDGGGHADAGDALVAAGEVAGTGASTHRQRHRDVGGDRASPAPPTPSASERSA